MAKAIHRSPHYEGLLQVGLQGRRNVPRGLAVYLASRTGGFRTVEICEYFHPDTYGP